VPPAAPPAPAPLPPAPPAPGAPADPLAPAFPAAPVPAVPAAADCPPAPPGPTPAAAPAPPRESAPALPAPLTPAIPAAVGLASRSSRPSVAEQPPARSSPPSPAALQRSVAARLPRDEVPAIVPFYHTRTTTAARRSQRRAGSSSPAVPAGGWACGQMTRKPSERCQNFEQRDFGVPSGIRTRVSGVKSRCPGPTRRWGPSPGRPLQEQRSAKTTHGDEAYNQNRPTNSTSLFFGCFSQFPEGAHPARDVPNGGRRARRLLLTIAADDRFRRQTANERRGPRPPPRSPSRRGGRGPRSPRSPPLGRSPSARGGRGT
jgi:hypothetical protein